MRPTLMVLSLMVLALAGCTTGPTPPLLDNGASASSCAGVPAGNGTIAHGTGPAKFAHEHATFALVINNQNVSFRAPDYDASRVFGRTHFHVGEQNGGSVIHIEANFPGGQPDVPLAEFFGQYNVTLRAGKPDSSDGVPDGCLQLDTHDGHNGTAWLDRGAQRWRVLVSHVASVGRTGFDDVPAPYDAFVMRNGDKVLVTYGDLSPAQLAQQEAGVPDPP